MYTPQLLLGAPVVDSLFEKTKRAIDDNNISGYIAIFMLGENNPSATYVRKKIAYAERLGLQTKIFDSIENIYQDIESCNSDTMCLGVIIQLPLPVELASQKQRLLDAVDPLKDIDCLGQPLIKQSNIGTCEINIIPATPAAVMHLFDYYNITDTLQDASIAILGESDLIGKPLAQHIRNITKRHLYTEVVIEKTGLTECKDLVTENHNINTFNEFSDQNQMRSICQSSDIIIAATGKLHLVDETFVRDNQTQIMIDVGRGMLNGKAAGDIDMDKIADKIKAITPVPGGVGPVTVASLFWHIIVLRQARNQ